METLSSSLPPEHEPSQEFAKGRRELNAWLRQPDMPSWIGRENADRLIDLFGDDHRPIIDESVASRLGSIPPDNRPLAPGLRAVEDFTDTGIVFFKDTLTGMFITCDLLGSEQNRVILKRELMLRYVPPTFPGLMTHRDFAFYMSKADHRGIGTGKSALTVNLELTDLLTKIGIGEKIDQKLLRAIQRTFQTPRDDYPGLSK